MTQIQQSKIFEQISLQPTKSIVKIKAYHMSKQSDTPSLGRLRHIVYRLGAEQKYKTTQESEDYVKGAEKIPFPKHVWQIARAIQCAGLDPITMSKKEVFAWADHAVFGAPVPATVAATPQAATQVQTASVAPVAQQPQVEEQPVAPLSVPVRIAIYTLLISARELTHLDRKPGNEELGKLIDAAATAYLTALNKKQEVVVPVVQTPAPIRTVSTPVAETPQIPSPVA